VFTLPAELRAIVRTHARVLLPVLMQTAAAARQALAADPHYLSGTVGMLAVLPTWTRTLVYHPPVHCLVPGGGLAIDGETWRRARGHYLVPVRALSVGFRARFLMRLKRLLPEVVVPVTVWKRPWVVYAKPTVQGADCVLRYLARYVHRAAITDARIVRVDARTVTFRYQEAQARAWRTMTLAGEEFLRRLLQHVLPRGLHKVRYYGWWRPQAAATRTQLQQQLAPPAPVQRDRVADGPGGIAPAPCCPQCGTGHLLRTRRLLRVRALARPP
ncbi:transposase, partial [Gemmatimonas sp.]|uniref:IS91 family transposase n=1 Tax=Gemmatimonas sp. TaxID=1962908 RepID=UPI003983252C